MTLAPKARIVTLTTDFGLSDSYVGAMKGVLLSCCPDVQLVDISHEVPPQNVAIGAMRLAAAARFFPAGTVHLAVVDPGVGGSRRAVAVSCGGHFFVGPDNGLLSLAAPKTTPGWRAAELTVASAWLPSVSSTFHGRDVFAPVAARLAAGSRLEEVGDPTNAFVELGLRTPTVLEGRILGVVSDVDRFGNLITNVRETHLNRSQVAVVSVKGRSISGTSSWYDPAQEFVALVNGEGWLEISAPGGSAAATLGATIGTPVEVRLA